MALLCLRVTAAWSLCALSEWCAVNYILALLLLAWAAATCLFNRGWMCLCCLCHFHNENGVISTPLLPVRGAIGTMNRHKPKVKLPNAARAHQSSPEPVASQESHCWELTSSLETFLQLNICLLQTVFSEETLCSSWIERSSQWQAVWLTASELWLAESTYCEMEAMCDISPPPGWGGQTTRGVPVHLVISPPAFSLFQIHIKNSGYLISQT